MCNQRDVMLPIAQLSVKQVNAGKQVCKLPSRHYSPISTEPLNSPHSLAGLFPTTVSDLDNLTAPYHSYSATSAEQRNARLVQLLRFYGAEADGKSWPAAEALPDGGYACMEEFGRRAGYLKTFLRLE